MKLGSRCSGYSNAHKTSGVETYGTSNDAPHNSGRDRLRPAAGDSILLAVWDPPQLERPRRERLADQHCFLGRAFDDI